MNQRSIDGRWRLVGFGLLFFLASGFVASSDSLWGEVGITEALNSMPDDVVDGLAIVMQLGTTPAILLVAVVAVVVTPGDWRRAGLAVVLAGALSWVLSDVAKEVVERPRPVAYSSEIELHDDAAGFGWPSTHASIAAGTLVAASLVARRRPGAALLLVAVVGVARMAVGVHLPLDVVGGIGLGVAIAAVVTAIVDP